ncbi:murein biosynthesis integral membrane protein MurJ [Limnobacter sp. SAORIC-690]|uniref:murein biosynthesis integral membrane protein MurJ n=1 Tax=Limnobacter sp. SAORIC-690 TaxID=1923970 RepID=UPI000CF476D5|nr:murein biosynthesis integral membrane protein MurJ [Limnobacter sp. SAORIC-690]PQJ26255.1 murein biosynthesis integral membrane protein MurJ [Limnobacter sp. SAORIC-690]
MNLLKSAAAVSAMTMLSRITGLIRETITARLLGAGAESDAFFIAFRIPNLLRRLFAEGAFSQAFIPILSQTNATQGKSAAVDLARRVSSLLFIVLLLIVVAGVLGGSWVVMGMASGLAQGSEQFELTVLLTQWMFPYILLISMVALASGLLNTFRSFALPAFAPVLLNISFIAGALLLAPYFDQAVKAFAVAVMVGGVLQVAVLWYGLARTDCLINPFAGFGAIKAAWGDEQVRRVLKNMVPATLAVSVAQISLIINTNIASHLEQGSVSWISYGDRLMEFPTALLGVALGTVLLPSLSAAATRSHEEYSRLMDWGLRLTVVLVLPAAVGMGLFSDALVALLFHYGRFDANDVAMTSQAVIAYSLGLAGLVLVKILAPGFYAKQDIRTPVKIGIVVVLATQLMNLFTVPWLGHAGLPLSISAGAVLNATVLYRGLRKRGLYTPSSGWGLYLIKVSVAATAMGFALWLMNQQFDWLSMASTPLVRVAAVLGVIGVCGVLYFAVLAALGLNPKRLIRKPAV